MMKQLLFGPIFLFSAITLAQTTITGKVTDNSGIAITGANVYLEGTYDGASTDDNGNFTFITLETGTQKLTVSMISFETHTQATDVSSLKDLKIVLREAVNALNGVTLTAGTFEAGDNSKASVLKPLDIVTTAGAVGDFVGALQTLPGTAKVSEDGRLFVRGGAAGETQVFIDGLRVFRPFNATAANIPTRGRFSPFLFKGISFSTGGYSAEYGQALSSVLLLNTTDVPDQEKTDVSIMSVGGGLGHTEIFGNRSLSVNTSYINLAPYESGLPSHQGVKWNRPYESISGEAVFRSKGEKSMFKLYTGFNYANLDIEQEDINFDDFVRFTLKNDNLYFNSSYKKFFENEWTLTTGAGVSFDRNIIGLLGNDIEAREKASHLKVKVRKSFSNRLKLAFGAENLRTDYDEKVTIPQEATFNSYYTDNLVAGFAETDIFFSNDFAMKLGARVESSSVTDAVSISPRTSLAYKTGDNGQFSLAYGQFYQNPLTDILKYDQDLESEKTSHYLFNYQYRKKGKTFRAEAYYKVYENLVKFDTPLPVFNSEYNNTGGGHAAGLDVFWRDNKSIDNLDYWVSYSYLDTKRDFRDFKEKATPDFAPKHNLSVVTKYFITDWRSQVGLSYGFASGRPYDNPNTRNFLAEKTKAFHSLSLNWAYLISQQKILFLSISNLTGANNVNGYQYADTPDINGTFNRRAIRPAADSFFFVGFFWTISKDKKSNQLNNL